MVEIRAFVYGEIMGFLLFVERWLESTSDAGECKPKPFWINKKSKTIDPGD